LGTGYWVLGTGYWVLGTGYWVLGTGYWVLGTGYWVLAIAPDSALQSHDVADAVERGDVARVAIGHFAVDGDEIAAAELVHLSPRVERDAAAVAVFLVYRGEAQAPLLLLRNERELAGQDAIVRGAAEFGPGRDVGEAAPSR